MKRKIPVYLIAGFMDCGKTTMIKETLLGSNLSETIQQSAQEGTQKVLLIQCEDGEEEYDRAKLQEIGVRIVTIPSEEDFSRERLEQYVELLEPEIIFIEYNGTWEIAHIWEEMPKELFLAQYIGLVDASTFELYYSNMQAMLMEQLFRAEVIIVNRCDQSTPRMKFRAMIKNWNPSAQIVYENKEGHIMDEPEELPYDISANELMITDTDYARFVMDCMDHPINYEGKIVSFRAMIFRKKKIGTGKERYYPGRLVMTCCAEDVRFFGMVCKFPKSFRTKDQSWYVLTARIQYEEAWEYYDKKGPVLYPIEINPCETPEDIFVYV